MLDHARNKPWWYCTLTRKMQTDTPKSSMGSILADNMGLGQVCIFLYRYISVDHMMIRIDIRKPFTQQSIFVTTFSPHRRCLQSICLILSNHPDLDEGEPCCTLIVSPVSIIAN
mmetsp:Transcript_14207/g.25718  ORF Transcript_14207/g.25718 Transcript_14207/m.25718 type:complete len:114 (+) Transcript_14207:1862-2203(+)